MLPRFRVTLAILLIVTGCAGLAGAQGTVGTQADPRHVDGAEFGKRLVLGPGWLFKPGDNPAWASPTLDDSGWQTISTDKELLDYGIHDIRYGWYRAHVHLRPGTRDLAIGLERTYGSYEVFVNGVRVGGNGDMAGLVRFAQRTLTTYAVPDDALMPTGDLVLAIRFSVDASGSRGPGTSMPLRSINPTLSSGVYVLSRDEAPRDQSYANAHDTYDDLLIGGMALVAGLVALALCLTLRSDREYLAATVYLLSAVGYYACWLWADTVAYTVPNYWLVALTHATAAVALIEFVRLVLQRPRTRGLLALQVAAFVASFGVLLSVNGVGGSVNFGFFAYYVPILLVDISLAVMLVRGWRRGNRDSVLHAYGSQARVAAGSAHRQLPVYRWRHRRFCFLCNHAVVPCAANGGDCAAACAGGQRVGGGARCATGHHSGRNSQRAGIPFRERV